MLKNNCRLTRSRVSFVLQREEGLKLVKLFEIYGLSFSEIASTGEPREFDRETKWIGPVTKGTFIFQNGFYFNYLCIFITGNKCRYWIWETEGSEGSHPSTGIRAVSDLWISMNTWRVEHILSDLYGSSSNHLDLRFSISMDSTSLVFRIILDTVSQTSLAVCPGLVCIL